MKRFAEEMLVFCIEIPVMAAVYFSVFLTAIWTGKWGRSDLL